VRGFYVSDFHYEYPKVDGERSQPVLYLHAIDACFMRFWDKKERTATAAAAGPYIADCADHFVFYSSFTKLVLKSFASAILQLLGARLLAACGPVGSKRLLADR
jgi:3-hydroxy-3-methylglutaryl CoA synthase